MRCDAGFVLTGTAVAELDVALPARPEVANLLTYWMKTLGAENGTTYSSIQNTMWEEPLCPLYPAVGEIGDLEPMNLSNFAAPLLLLAAFMGAPHAHCRTPIAARPLPHAHAARPCRTARAHAAPHVSENYCAQGAQRKCSPHCICILHLRRICAASVPHLRRICTTSLGRRTLPGPVQASPSPPAWCA